MRGLPKIEFKLASFKYNYQILNYFVFHKSPKIRKRILNVYPELRKIYSIKKNTERDKFIREFCKRQSSKNSKAIMKKKEIIDKEWRKIHTPFMKALSKVLEIKWPNTKIIGYLSIVPVYPRHLNNWSFSFYYKENTKGIIAVIAHEISHFLYFKKFKELFPKINKRRYDIPYIEWYLSEMLAPIILAHPKIKKIIGKRIQRGYILRKREKLLYRKLLLLYKDSLKNREPFSEFLKKTYRLVKRINRGFVVKGFP
ncbi:MAG: hypothetical protein IB618_03755 [Candidatus Pacearchaeota archaeon]|nr:MAG: hypothetical protein IB618_03755 [Candidatus Pacearchaeota archaeon]